MGKPIFGLSSPLRVKKTYCKYSWEDLRFSVTTFYLTFTLFDLCVGFVGHALTQGVSITKVNLKVTSRVPRLFIIGMCAILFFLIQGKTPHTKCISYEINLVE